MKCKHCRASNEIGVNMSIETIKKVLVFAKANSEEYFCLTISGGEPFCHPDLLDIIKLAKNMGIENIAITTNGSLVTDRLIKELESIAIENLHIQVSIDSVNPQKHNLFRGHRMAFEKAIICLTRIAGSNIFPSLRMAVLPSTIDEMDAMIKLAMECNITSIGFNPVIPIGRGGTNRDLVMNPVQKRNFLDNLVYCIKNYPEMDITTEDPLQCLAHDFSLANCDDMAFFGGCTAGITSFGVSSIGDITACALLSKPIVNINDGTPEEISEIYAKSEIILSLISRKYKGKCGTCSLKRMCGGCRAVAEGVNGDYLSSDITCWR